MTGAELPVPAVPDQGEVREQVRRALATVEDPCMASAGLDLSVLDLGLVYDVRVDGARVEVDLTFTELGCAFTHVVMSRVTDAVEQLDGVEEVQVRPVWLPGWSRERLSGRARSALGETSARLSTLPPGRTRR